MDTDLSVLITSSGYSTSPASTVLIEESVEIVGFDDGEGELGSKLVGE